MNKGFGVITVKKKKTTFFLNLYLQKLQKPNLAVLMNASQQFKKNSKLFGKDCVID